MADSGWRNCPNGRKTPCQHCRKREPGCHGRCADYQTFRAECDRHIALHHEDMEAKIMTVTRRIALNRHLYRSKDDARNKGRSEQ